MIQKSLLGFFLLSACQLVAVPQIPDAQLAEIPYEKKESMRLAKEEVDRSSLLNQRASLAFQESQAFYELAQSKLALSRAFVSVAKTYQNSAVSTSRQEEIEEAEFLLVLAKGEEEIAQARLLFSKAELALAKYERTHSKTRVKAKQADYEMIKLRLLEENNAAAGYDSARLQSRLKRLEAKYLQRELARKKLVEKRDQARKNYEDHVETIALSLQLSPEKQKRFEKRMLRPGELNTLPFLPSEEREQIPVVVPTEIPESLREKPTNSSSATLLSSHENEQEASSLPIEPSSLPLTETVAPEQKQPTSLRIAEPASLPAGFQPSSQPVESGNTPQ